LSYLLNGQALTGSDELPLPGVRGFYQAGYSVVTAVAAVLGGSIATQFHYALFFNIAFVILTGIVLYALVSRHFSITKKWAILIASCVSLAPSVAAFSLFAYAESLSRLLFSLVIFLLFEISKRTTYLTMLAIGATAGFLPIVHGRFVLVLPLTVVAMIAVVLGAEQRQLRHLVVGVISALIVYAIFNRMNATLRDDLYLASFGKEDRMLRRLLTLNEWPHILRSAAGQMWYLISTSLGLVFVGLAAIVAIILKQAKQRLWTETIPFMFTLGAVVAIVLTSALQLTNVTRPDHLIYGRYVEVVSPILIVIAGATLVSAKWHHAGNIKFSSWSFKAWIAAMCAMVLLFLALIIAGGGDRLHNMLMNNRYFSPPNAISVDWTRSLFVPIGYVTLTIGFLLLTSVLVSTWWRSPAIGIVLLGTLGSLATVYTATQTVIPYRESREELVLDERIDQLTLNKATNDTEIAVNIDTPATDVFVDYRYLVHPIQLLPVTDNQVIPHDVNCVISDESTPPSVNQWVAMGTEPSLDLTLWVRTGLNSC
jgi:hypothetical protein